MKKILSVFLSVMMLLSVASLAGCGKKEEKKTSENLKFGMGVHSYVENLTDAKDDAKGSGQAVVTVAAVLLDGNGKIVKCAIDTAANELAFTAEGKLVEAKDFKTKYEMGDAYGMKAYAGAKKEWYEQVDAFNTVVVGKTVDGVKALVAKDSKGNDDVVNAGCTITVSDFVLAIEKAVKNAASSKATEESTLKLGVVSVQTGSKDATADAEGVNEVDTTVAASVLDKNGKVLAMDTDAVQNKITFDAKGAVKANQSSSKKEAGESYGMSKYGQDLNGDNVVKEWFQQAEAFNKACVGKNASEISALAVDTGYGDEALQKAGCTINVSDMVKAAVKAATVG